MDDPIAYFLTWSTYGTWLPGDSRGWTEYHRGWQMPDPVRKLEAEARMVEDACLLSPVQRRLVEGQVAETCLARGWCLYAVNCRSNHVHVVLGAHSIHPNKVRADLKAWCTRRLRKYSESTRTNWWAERGSQRYIYQETNLCAVIEYVTEAQNRKHLDH